MISAQNQRGSLVLIALVILGLITASILIWWKYSKSLTPISNLTNPQAAVCTMEAKVCPDGSSIGRSGPKCEFSKCPEITYSNYNDPNGFSIQYPANWVLLEGVYPNTYEEKSGTKPDLKTFKIFAPNKESTNSAEITSALGYIELGPSQNRVPIRGDGYIGTDIYSDRFFNYRPNDWRIGPAGRGVPAADYQEPENTTIDNKNAMKQISTPQGENPTYKTINYYIPLDDRSGDMLFLSFSYNTEGPNAKDYLGIFEQMVRSLKFRK